MKEKPRLRVRLTLLVGTILLVSNALLVLLLLYNFSAALAGFLIPVNGEMIEYHFVDGLEAQLLVLGIVIAVCTTALGTFLTYMLLGKVLRPLQQLTHHMEMVDQEDMICPAEITSRVCEVDSLITSFNSMTEKLQRTFDNQKQFSAFVAHELRTPLAVIQTKADVYRKSPDGTPEELIDLISAQVAKLSTLVTQIMDLANIQSEALRDRIPVRLLLEEVSDDLEEFAQERQVRLLLPESSAASETEMVVVGNHNLLYQAFFNLMENGIKYNHAGGWVAVEFHEGEGMVCTRLTDSGGGIPEEEQEAIFRAFYRCERADARGHGIGLALTKRIIEHHKGVISQHNIEGGSCFDVCLHAEKR